MARVRSGKKSKRFVPAVVPGDRRVDPAALNALLGGSYAGFATPEVADRLAGSVSGTILPFSFDEEPALIVDGRCWSSRRSSSTRPGWTGHRPW
ncbi:YbaK/EbsC family protein [Streptomyces sp. NPDC101393]|uniref:YbaK/EbsC family protein n=1 Tax=Streptomyces sp. NPDC101393 TaxID=3366141 RepID=UPI0038043261